MAYVPMEPEGFAEHVAEMVRRLQPEYTIELVGYSELIINGRRLDLGNLRRMVDHDPSRGNEIVDHYLDQLFSSDGMQLSGVTLEFARTRVMPRIQPVSIFDHLSRELVAHIPFVNDTVVVFVLDLPQMTVSITTEQMLQWGLGVEDLEEYAKKNLDRYVPDLEVQLVESKEGGRAAILSEQDGYDAARLLLSGLFDRLAPQLGGDFLVATPARDMFVAMSRGPRDFIHRLHDRVAVDYKRLPYPITSEFFYVTRDGVAGSLAAA
ncbi:MAG: DUF1444 family protein [Planctomycetes bacterium]|nr:DUF1444 family protein [Planctomycetota bacterium]